MEKNKYYIPHVEEFYVGFEFYFKDRISNRSADFVWTPQLVGLADRWAKTFNYDLKGGHITVLGDLQEAIELDRIRCKYLDKEDIENLGFHIDKSREFNLIAYTHNSVNKYQIDFYPNYEKKVLFNIIITDLINMRSIKIYIKNKSELKQLLTQLGIQ